MFSGYFDTKNVAYLGESLSTNVAGEHFVGLVMYSLDVVFQS